jgi:hypothetical protein
MRRRIRFDSMIDSIRSLTIVIIRSHPLQHACHQSSIDHEILYIAAVDHPHNIIILSSLLQYEKKAITHFDSARDTHQHGGDKKKYYTNCVPMSVEEIISPPSRRHLLHDCCILSVVIYKCAPTASLSIYTTSIASAFRTTIGIHPSAQSIR